MSSKKLMARFSTETAETLRNLGQNRDLNVGEVIKRAIGLYVWAHEEQKKGNVIASLNQKGYPLHTIPYF